MENITKRPEAIKKIRSKFESMDKLIAYTNGIIKHTIAQEKNIGVDIDFPHPIGDREMLLKLVELLKEAGYLDVRLKVNEDKTNYVISLLIF